MIHFVFLRHKIDGACTIGQFKHRYPHVYTVADVGEVVLGKPGRWICAIINWLCMYLHLVRIDKKTILTRYGLALSSGMTCVAGSALLSISIAFNAMSLHGTCTAVFVVVGTVIVYLFAIIPTLDKVAWVTWSGALSLVVSCECCRQLVVGMKY